MSEREIYVAIALEEPCLTIDQLAAACAVERAWVVRIVEEGFVAPMEGPADSWRFGASALNRARAIRRIERDFDAVPELAALVVDMIEEIERLRRRS